MAYSKATIEKIRKNYMAMYEDYRDAVLSGARIASVCEKQKVQRQERMLSDGVTGYKFDWDKALRPLVWITCNLVFPLGAKRGKPFVLSPFQAYDLMCLFGWVHEETGERLYMLSYFEVARKNGKSVLAGALEDYFAFGEVKGVDCYVAATSLDQAEETFKRAADALMLAGHKSVKVANSKNNKLIEWNGSRIRAISAAPKDGKLAYFTVLDEYHQHKTNELKDSILSGNVSDQQSHLMHITTAGTDLNGVAFQEVEKCRRILSGQEVNDHYFVSIYEADEGDLPGDESTWYKANPNLGVSVSLNSFRGIYENAKPSESDMITFKTKNLNMWVRGSTHFFRMPIWEEKCRWYVDPEELRGARCYGGLDLSSVYDFTAFTMCFPMGGTHVLLNHFWVAENQVEGIARKCRIPLRQWISDGYVTSTPGDVIDYSYVMDYLNECRAMYDLRYIACDQWHMHELMTIMPPWFGETAYEFSQGMKTMNAALQKFERAYMEGTVTGNANPVLDYMCSCADVKVDTSGNRKMVKPNKQKSSTRIDGCITSLMAYHTAVSLEGEDDGEFNAESIVFF